MKYLKLWRYVLCPFYVNFAPYIVMSALIFNTIGCTQKPSQKEILHAANLIRGEEDECKEIAEDLGALDYTYGNAESTSGDNWLCEFFSDSSHTYQSRHGVIYREEMRPILRYLSIKKHLKEKEHEACKFPKPCKPKASPSPSKN